MKMNNNVSFGAKFEVHNSVLRYNNFDNEKIESLSRNLDKDTPKNYKVILNQRDDLYGQDTYCLRRKNKDGQWESLSAITIKMLSQNALNPERLYDIFTVLKLKAQHNYSENLLQERLDCLKKSNREKLNESLRLFDLNV